MFPRGGEEEEEEEEVEGAQIPTDLYEEILYRLPSDDLLPFKRVCKKWRSLISSLRFIKKHLERSKAGCSDDSRVVVSENSESTIIDCKNDIITIKKIPLGPVRILGLCDGLALYYKDAIDVMIALNPCTRKFEVRTPNPSLHNDLNSDDLMFTWFGRHPCTGEYVLVAARVLEIGTKKRVVFNVHSLSRNTLLSSSTSEEMGGPVIDYYSFQRVGILLHGRLHYPLGSRAAAMILVYDLGTNKIERMSCPPTSTVCALGVVDGCLCAFPLWEVWVMKEYGVKESWTRYYEDIEGNNIDSSILTGFIPIAVCPNNDLILIGCAFRMLAKYSLRNKEIKPLMASKTLIGIGIHSVTVTSCIDSLVSPASVWAN